MPVPQSDPLQRFAHVQQLTDAEVRRLVTMASREAARVIRTTSGIRQAQVRLARDQLRLWASVGDATAVGIGDAFDAATDSQTLFDTDLFERTGMSQRYWRMSMLATSRAGIDSYLGRRLNTMTLSQRVYRDGQASIKAVNDVVNSGLLLGKGPRELAKDVERFISPSTPGGVAYAAMRLARTETNNAFHFTQIKQMIDSPWVTSAIWNLSGSHPRPDACNDYAERVNFKGGQPGEFKPEDVPGKPHPNCLCYITPVTIPDEDFIKKMKNGSLDDYVSSVGCSALA